MDRTDSTVSPEIVPAAATLNIFLEFLSKTVATAVFRRVLRRLGTGIQSWMWDYVITRNKFSSAGGKQFSTDMSEIWNTCSKYVEDPTASMKMLKDVCVLLTLPISTSEGEAKPRLKEVVRAIFEDSDKAQAILARLELANISVNDARIVLRGRVEAWT